MDQGTVLEGNKATIRHKSICIDVVNEQINQKHIIRTLIVTDTDCSVSVIVILFSLSIFFVFVGRLRYDVSTA